MSWSHYPFFKKYVADIQIHGLHEVWSKLDAPSQGQYDFYVYTKLYTILPFVMCCPWKYLSNFMMVWLVEHGPNSVVYDGLVQL